MYRKIIKNTGYTKHPEQKNKDIKSCKPWKGANLTAASLCGYRIAVFHFLPVNTLENHNSTYWKMHHPLQKYTSHIFNFHTPPWNCKAIVLLYQNHRHYPRNPLWFWYNFIVLKARISGLSDCRQNPFREAITKGVLLIELINRIHTVNLRRYPP